MGFALTLSAVVLAAGLAARGAKALMRRRLPPTRHPRRVTLDLGG